MRTAACISVPRSLYEPEDAQFTDTIRARKQHYRWAGSFELSADCRTAAGTIDNAASTRIPFNRLVTALSNAPELAAILEDVTKEPQLASALVLSHGTDDRKLSRLELLRTFALVLVERARNGYEGRPSDVLSIGKKDVEAFPIYGPELLAALELALARPVTPAVNTQADTLLQSFRDSRCRARPELFALLMPPVASSTPKASIFVAPPAPIEAMKATHAAKLTATDLVLALSYGASDIQRSVLELVQTKPSSPLAMRLLANDEVRESLKTRVRGPALWDVEPEQPSGAHITAAIMALFHRYTGPSGTLDLARYARDTSGEGLTLLQSLAERATQPEPAQPNFRFLADVLVQTQRCFPDDARAITDAWARCERLIPKRIPVLDRARAATPKDAAKDRGLVAIQHLFPTSVPLMEALIAVGMKPGQMHVLGTPYASNPLVVAYLQLLGVDARPGTDRGGATREFEDARMEEVGNFLSAVSGKYYVNDPETPEQGFVVLDDGGMLHSAIAGSKIPRNRAHSTDQILFKRFAQHPLRGVEQTTRGLTEIGKFTPAYGIVKVADAPGKKEEGDIIGWALAEALSRDLGKVGKAVRRVSIVGAGVIGIRTAAQLRALGYTVSLVDTDPKKLEAAKNAGYAVYDSLTDAAKQCDVIFGCTGKTSIAGAAIAGFSGIIASGSSAAIEFDTDEVAGFCPNAMILNRARPINFQGDGHENLGAANIGLTRALLFCAVTQEAQTPGLQALAASPQDAVVEFWLKNGGKTLGAIGEGSVALVRPDERGTASHDEWMTFLKNGTAKVFPLPDVTADKPGNYFFTEPDGSVRVVDTSTGLSRATPLKAIPSAVHHGGIPHGEHNTIVQGEDADGTHWIASSSPSTGLFSDPIKVNGLLTTYEEDHSPMRQGPSDRSRLWTGFVFSTDTGLLVVPPGQWDGRFAIAEKPGGRYLWLDRHSLMRFSDTGDARLIPVSQDRDFPPRVAWPKLTSLGAIYRNPLRPASTFLIGRNAASEVVVFHYDRNAREHDQWTLPKDAVVRDVAIGQADERGNWLRGVVRISYTLPGDSAEIEARREVLYDAEGIGTLRHIQGRLPYSGIVELLKTRPWLQQAVVVDAKGEWRLKPGTDLTF